MAKASRIEENKPATARASAAFAPRTTALSGEEFRQITSLMYQRFGIDLRTGKEGLVEARLGKRLRAGGFATFGAYFEHAVTDRTGEALIEMVDSLTTNHTSFLRERAHFDFLVKTILPGIPARSGVEIWSAACSTGEEPYSIACTAIDALGGDSRLRILATDLSTRVLSRAKEGVYPAERFSEFSPAWMQTFLRKEPDGNYRFKPEVVARIDFKRLNLMEPVTHGRRFHVIFCRNVMMYFDRGTQQSVVGRLSACLEPGGYLFVGHSETLSGIEHNLRYISPAIYRNDAGGAARRPV